MEVTQKPPGLSHSKTPSQVKGSRHHLPSLLPEGI